MKAPRDDRAIWAKAYQLAGRAVAVSISMILPGMMGYGLDRYWGLQGLFTILGFGLGLTYGIWQLTRLTGSSGGDGD